MAAAATAKTTGDSPAPRGAAPEGAPAGEERKGGGEAKAGQGGEGEQQTQAQMASEAVQHLRDLRGGGAAAAEGGLSEEHARVVFDRYDSRGAGAWTYRDLRFFLCDLQEAFDAPRVVPDEALDECVRMMRLNLEGSGGGAAAEAGVTWLEFKSFLLFLQSQPLETLNLTVTKHAHPALIEHAVAVTSLPDDVTPAVLRGLFSPCGEVRCVFVTSENGPQALVGFRDAASVEGALKMHGVALGDKLITVQRRSGDFPDLVFHRKPSLIARGLATVVVTLSEFDRKHNVRGKLRAGADAVSAKVSQFADEHGITEKARAAADAAAAKSREIDDKYKLSEKKKQVAAKVSAVASSVAANPTVASGLGALQKLGKKIDQKLTDFKAETAVAVAEKEKERAAARAGAPAPAAAPAPAKESAPAQAKAAAEDAVDDEDDDSL
jgi:hypothetical protein